jgi:hypothetical protein
MREYITIGVQMSSRPFLKLLFLYYAIYTWYYGFLVTLDALQTQYSMQPSFFLAFSFAIAATLIVSGATRAHQNTANVHLIYAWAGLSLLLRIGFMTLGDPTVLAGLTVLAGGLFGMAAWTLALSFADVTVISERGRVGSLITAFTLFTTPIIVAISKQYPLPVQLFLSILAVLATTINTPSPAAASSLKASQPTNVVAHMRPFFLYFLPWLLLCLNNATFIQAISTQLKAQFLTLQMTAFTLEYLSAGLGTLLCGLVIDWIGRRSMALLSFTMLGITTCVSGLVPTPSLYLLFHLTSGFGWGSLLTLFLLIAWDEVPPPRRSGMKYGLGLSAYHLTQGIGILLAPLSFQISEAALLNAILMFLNTALLYGAQNLIPVEVKERMYYDLYLYQAKKLVT